MKYNIEKYILNKMHFFLNIEFNKEEYLDEKDSYVKWAERFHVQISDDLLENAFLHSIILFPNSRRLSNREHFVKHDIWVFSLDDYLDDPETSLEELIHFQNLLVSSMWKKKFINSALIDSMIDEWSILEEAGGFECYSLLFLKSLYEMLGGMRRERIESSFIDFEDYIHEARITIGIPTTFYMQAMIFNEKAPLDFPGLFDKIVKEGGELCRLSNDVASHEREKNIKKDSIFFLENEENVLARIDDLVVSYFRNVCLFPVSNEYKHFLLNTVFVTVLVYLNQDYREKFSINMFQ